MYQTLVWLAIKSAIKFFALNNTDFVGSCSHVVFRWFISLFTKNKH